MCAKTLLVVVTRQCFQLDVNNYYTTEHPMGLVIFGTHSGKHVLYQWGVNQPLGYKTCQL